MAKKIIELNEGTERIELYEYASVDEKGPDYPNGERDVLVEDFPDIPKWYTVELPTDELKDIREAYRTSKESGKQTVFDFLLTASDMSIHTDFDLLAKWYLGGVDLVPLKEENFIVIVTIGLEEKLVMRDTLDSPIEFVDNEDWVEDDGAVFLPESGAVFTRKEAEELVRGLSALNAHKVYAENG